MIPHFRTIVMFIFYAYFYRVFKVGPRGGRNLNWLDLRCPSWFRPHPGGVLNPSLGP